MVIDNHFPPPPCNQSLNHHTTWPILSRAISCFRLHLPVRLKIEGCGFVDSVAIDCSLGKLIPWRWEVNIILAGVCVVMAEIWGDCLEKLILNQNKRAIVWRAYWIQLAYPCAIVHSQRAELFYWYFHLSYHFPSLSAPPPSTSHHSQGRYFPFLFTQPHISIRRNRSDFVNVNAFGSLQCLYCQEKALLLIYSDIMHIRNPKDKC